MQDEVFEQLRRHLAQAAHVDVSQYRFINLDAVRSAAGGRWDSIRDRVFVASDSIIRKHVADDDMIVQCDSGFLVIYRDREGEAAKAVTDAIAADMKAFFLGDTLTSLLDVEGWSEQLSVAEFAATLDAAGAAQDAVPTKARANVRAISRAPLYSDIIYHPVWDPKHEAVASFSARPRRWQSSGAGWVHGHAVIRDGHDAKARVELDLAVMADVLSAGLDLKSNGAKCGLLLPVGYPVLSHAETRSRYATALSRWPGALKKLIILKVEDAPLDAPSAQVIESCRTLLPHCGRLVIHAPLDALSLSRFEGAGAALIGTTLPPSADNRGLDQAIARFAALSQRIACPFYLEGVNDWSLLKAALRSKARFIVGAAIAERTTLELPYRLARSTALSNAA